MKPALATIALLAASLAGAPAASAHAFLDHAVPAVGSTVATAPTTIRLFFTEAVEPHFSAVTLAAAAGDAVATAAATPDPHNPAELVLAVPNLAPGHYTVAWQVVSIDTHRTQGHFTLWRAAAVSRRCHRSAFFTGLPAAVRQPLRFHCASHSVMPFCT